MIPRDSLILETVDGGRTWREAFIDPGTRAVLKDIDVLTTASGIVAWAVGDKGSVLMFESAVAEAEPGHVEDRV